MPLICLGDSWFINEIFLKNSLDTNVRYLRYECERHPMYIQDIPDMYPWFRYSQVVAELFKKNHDISKRYTWDLSDIYTQDTNEICLRFNSYNARICLWYTWDIPGICVRNICHIHIWNKPEIYERFTMDMHEIYRRCTQDIHETYPRYSQDMQEIYPRCIVWLRYSCKYT